MTSQVASSLDEVQLTEQANLREDELLALEAILPAGVFSKSTSTNPTSSLHADAVWLNIPAMLPDDVTIAVHTIQSKSETQIREPDDTGIGSSSRSITSVTKLQGLTYLPPLKVLIHLPKDYPAYSPPKIVHIQSEYLNTETESKATMKRAEATAMMAASWRSEVVSWFKEALVEQWKDFEGEILYTWYEFLRESIWQEISDSSSRKNCPLRSTTNREIVLKEYISDGIFDAKATSPLATSLRSYDLLSKRKSFEGERFGCGICLEDKRGGKCWRIADCGHVFCQDCLSSYLSSMIKEGYIRQASSCPDPECVKARVAAELNQEIDASHLQRIGTISEEEMIQFVGESLVARLADLKDKALASTDPTAGYCPRPGCEKLVRADPTDVGTSYEAMRICQCGFTYCLYCNKAWHGKSPCNLVSSTALIERYQRAGEDSSIRREMELKYGRANLERMVRTYEEEMQNKQYIDSHTQSCPCCHVRIEKSMGCNHMTCRACNTHLCYRCGSRLNPREPYRHFNTPGTACFEKLFDHIGSVEAPGEWAYIGAEEEEMAMWEAEEL